MKYKQLLCTRYPLLNMEYSKREYTYVKLHEEDGTSMAKCTLFNLPDILFWFT